MRAFAIVALLCASCSYRVSFEDCHIGCAASECPDGFACGDEALCRAKGAIGTCAAIAAGDAGAAPVPGIYITDLVANQVLVFAFDATGNATPVRTISGPTTHLVSPIGIAIDHQGNIYVANIGGGVTVYPRDADGDVAPSRVIDVQRPVQLVLSTADDFFVVVQNGGVFHVPPGDATSDRNFLPVTTGGNPFLALDNTGDVILSAQGTIATYAATATGNATPLRSFTLQVSEDIAPALAFVGGAIAVTAETGEILVFDENTTGDATPTSTLAPAEIVHDKAGMSLAVDASSGSPVFYVGDAQLTTLFEVPATGSGANLVAGAVRSLTVPKEMAGIAVIP